MNHTLIQISFAALTVIFFGLLLIEIRKAIHQSPNLKNSNLFAWTTRIVLLWIVFVSVWSGSGKMGDFSRFPLNMMPVLAIPLIGTILFTLSRAGTEILSRIPMERIIQLNVFRVFVELLLWALYLENTAPLQMTFEGQNLDVLSGLSAPIIAYLYKTQKIGKSIVIGWNVVCLALLINIVSVAILSMPTPQRYFMNEPANTIVTEFPISWLPGLLVPLAYMLHFFSLRQIWMARKN